MINESDPIDRAVQARYDDIMTQYYRGIDKANAEHDASTAAWRQHVAEQDEKDKADLEQRLADKQREDEAKRAEQDLDEATKRRQANPWLARRQRAEHISFGTEDEETRSLSPAPRRPAAPPPPPAPRPPAPAPAPSRAVQRRDEESFDDDDYSNNSWMR